MNIESIVESIKKLPEAQNLSGEELTKFISDNLRTEMDKLIQQNRPAAPEKISSSDILNQEQKYKV